MAATWLTKGEVNERYYAEVGGEIVFTTEAQAGYHAVAVARLIAAQASARGVEELRILELGANDGTFAAVLLQLLGDLRGRRGPRKVDYYAGEWSRSALEGALAVNARSGRFDRVQRGRDSLVALLTSSTWPEASLYLVHAEANELARRSTGTFDVVILNELLDDLPSRVYYADETGATHELLAETREEEGGWTVRVRAEPAERVGLAPGTLTATSQESLTLVTRLEELLAPGGLLLVHDYGFADDPTNLWQYEELPRSLPPFVTQDFPAGSERGFPRAFYRVFGNEARRAIQITTDVNFGELVDVLAPNGDVLVLPHGTAILGERRYEPHDGVFVSEFALLPDNANLHARVARLVEQQGELRERYAQRYLGGKQAIFSDLVYVKR